jgi:hypothetical protein
MVVTSNSVSGCLPATVRSKENNARDYSRLCFEESDTVRGRLRFRPKCSSLFEESLDSVFVFLIFFTECEICLMGDIATLMCGGFNYNLVDGFAKMKSFVNFVDKHLNLLTVVSFYDCG